MKVTVEKNGGNWSVRVWANDVGTVVWTFRREVDARRLAMNLVEAA